MQTLGSEWQWPLDLGQVALQMWARVAEVTCRQVGPDKEGVVTLAEKQRPQAGTPRRAGPTNIAG